MRVVTMTDKCPEGLEDESVIALSPDTGRDLHGDAAGAELDDFLDHIDGIDRDQRYAERFGFDQRDPYQMEQVGFDAPLVFELGDIRSLLANWAFVQSAMSIEDPDRLLLNYTRLIMGFPCSAFTGDDRDHRAGRRVAGKILLSKSTGRFDHRRRNRPRGHCRLAKGAVDHHFPSTEAIFTRALKGVQVAVESAQLHRLPRPPHWSPKRHRPRLELLWVPGPSPRTVPRARTWADHWAISPNAATCGSSSPAASVNVAMPSPLFARQCVISR